MSVTTCANVFSQVQKGFPRCLGPSSKWYGSFCLLTYNVKSSMLAVQSSAVLSRLNQDKSAPRRCEESNALRVCRIETTKNSQSYSSQVAQLIIIRACEYMKAQIEQEICNNFIQTFYKLHWVYFSVFCRRIIISTDIRSFLNYSPLLEQEDFCNMLYMKEQNKRLTKGMQKVVRAKDRERYQFTLRVNLTQQTISTYFCQGSVGEGRGGGHFEKIFFSAEKHLYKWLRGVGYHFQHRQESSGNWQILADTLRLLKYNT